MSDRVEGVWTDVPRVAADADAVIKRITSHGFPAGISDDLWGVEHRLSAEAIVVRVRQLGRRTSPGQIRAGLQEIINEVELYRWGYDVGYEAGYAKALEDVRLDAVRRGQS